MRVSLKPKTINGVDVMPQESTVQKIGTCGHHSGDADMYSVLVSARHRFAPTFLCIVEEAVRECTTNDCDYSTTMLIAAFEIRCSAKSYSEIVHPHDDSDIMKALKEFFYREEKEDIDG